MKGKLNVLKTDDRFWLSERLPFTGQKVTIDHTKGYLRYAKGNLLSYDVLCFCKWFVINWLWGVVVGL